MVPERVTEGTDAVLAAIVARLIPADELGPGAVEAGVLDYFAHRMAGDASLRDTLDRGLASVDAHTATTHGAQFAELDVAAQEALLEDLESDRVPEVAPTSACFFDLVRRLTIEGMFGDPSWGGNAEQAGWRLLGYPGPRHEWTAADQALGSVSGDRP